MTVTREIQKEEAIKRMKLLGLFAPIIKQFAYEDLVSESVSPLYACYWINDEQRARVQEFEKEYGALVYHIIHSYTSAGEMESYLYVCGSPEEWEMDIEDIQYGCQLVYVYNKTDPEFSEFGSIGIQLMPSAGLKRVW